MIEMAVRQYDRLWPGAAAKPLRRGPPDAALAARNTRVHQGPRVRIAGEIGVGNEHRDNGYVRRDFVHAEAIVDTGAHRGSKSNRKAAS